jgi:hypothetical protein
MSPCSPEEFYSSRISTFKIHSLHNKFQEHRGLRSKIDMFKESVHWWSRREVGQVGYAKAISSLTHLNVTTTSYWEWRLGPSFVQLCRSVAAGSNFKVTFTHCRRKFLFAFSVGAVSGHVIHVRCNIQVLRHDHICHTCWHINNISHETYGYIWGLCSYHVTFSSSLVVGVKWELNTVRSLENFDANVTFGSR